MPAAGRWRPPGPDPDKVLAVGAGIAAPVDRDGKVLATQHFWSLFDVGLRAALKELHGWTVLLENDANLAALGERWRGSGAGVDDLVVLLAGERLGAGVMESGRLLHGRGGAAGEMGYLDLVEGVGSSDGIASLARQWSAAGGGPAGRAARRAPGASSRTPPPGIPRRWPSWTGSRSGWPGSSPPWRASSTPSRW